MNAKMNKVLDGIFVKGIIALMLGGLIVAGPAIAAEIKFKTNGGLKWETDDGKASGQFGGRIMVDANYFDDDVVDHETGLEFRRLRLFAKAQYLDYEGKVQLEFAGSDVDIKDAYIARKAFGGKITGGHFKQGFGLEELTSSKYITFVERSFPSEGIATSRKMGLAYNWHSDRNTFMASVYDPEDIDGGDADFDGTGFGGRFTWAPHADKGNVTHFGAALASEERTDLKIQLRPEAHLGEKTALLSLTDTTSLKTGEQNHEIDVTKFGLEGALVRGPYSLQAEWQTLNADGPASVNPVNSDQALNAFYVMGSYFLTGDARVYKAKSGAFDRVKPARPDGAWEIALRYDNAENDDTDAEAEAFTAGLNYYATSHVRYMFNLIKADMTPAGGSTDSPTVFLARWQLDF